MRRRHSDSDVAILVIIIRDRTKEKAQKREIARDCEIARDRAQE